jgi:hypothetical protein
MRAAGRVLYFFQRRFVVFRKGVGNRTVRPEDRFDQAGGLRAYSIGQQVSLDGPGRTYLKLAGVFTVTRLLPPLGVELQYRIKSEIEAHERVAVEQELRVVEVAKSIVAAASRLSSVDVNAARVFAGLS